MTATRENIDLLKAGKAVSIVDVPEIGFVMVDGAGAPDDDEFHEALEGLFTASYTAHFAARKAHGEAPKVMPLEALWWLDGTAPQDILLKVSTGEATMADTDRALWRWRAMIAQPDPITAADIAAAIEGQREKRPQVAKVRYERWREGLAAQIMHIGRYADEGPTIVRLHEGIRAAGYRPRGCHHEIYLGDPRRCAPQRLRTILRQPVEPERT